MGLPAGTKLGSYEVLAPLGAGGMGEVYRARDPRLGREVAIKVLPEASLTDEDRRRRFIQEAQAASKLNHPHIVTIHEIGSSDGIDFIVMELVPGKTLDALFPKNGMRLSEALRVAIPIADALAAAHARGIVHRDLKPGNVMVTPEGVVKVLDFGLAKLTQPDEASGEDNTTLSARPPLSHPGTAAGTPAYMSPEQASGGVVDVRSDIFSFGVVLYEMVTGRRPFAGNSSVEMLAAILKEQPKPPSELGTEVPRDLERIILRCLRKEPAKRFQHMADVKVELQELKEESDSQASAPAGTAAAKRRPLRPSVAAVVSGFVILLLAAGGWLWRSRRPDLPSPTVVQLTSERWAGAGSFSPDGTQIAYASAGEDGANWDIWVKLVGQAEARRLTMDPAAEGHPAWSPDGTQVAFLRYYGGTTRGFTYFAAGAIHLVSPLGGPARKVSDFPARLQLSWSPDGRWLAAAKALSGNDPPGGIYLISVATGEARPVTSPKTQAFDMSPSFSPDGRELAYVSCEGPYTLPFCDLYVVPLDSGLAPTGAARRLTQKRMEYAGLAWARDGRSIVYDGLWRVRADGGVPPERVEAAAGGRFPSTASGRDRLAFVRQVGDPDIYRLPLGGSPAPIVQSTFEELQPQYSPDGRRIALASKRAGGGGNEIWLTDANGQNLTRLTRGPGRSQGWPGWSPNGRSIVFDSVAEDGNRDVWTIDVDGSGLRRITHDPANDILPSWSRDGRFIYFTSNRTGRLEVWRVAPRGGMEEQVTRDGGRFPLESVDGRTLYYLKGGDTLMGRPTAGGDERTILPCVRAFGYAVAPRGILHHDCLTTETGGSPEKTFRYWDAATRQDRQVATVSADVIAGVTMSPDGQSIVYAGGMLTSDLMMIENFR